LAGKKVVIWEFAIRELTVGDWKDVPMKLAAPRAALTAGGLVVLGELETDAPVISTSDPYKDAIVYYKFKVKAVESGRYDRDELLAVMPIMRDKKILEPARWRRGDVYRLTLLPEPPEEIKT
jgi:hypothetical protein